MTHPLIPVYATEFETVENPVRTMVEPVIRELVERLKKEREKVLERLPPEEREVRERFRVCYRAGEYYYEPDIECIYNLVVDKDYYKYM